MPIAASAMSQRIPPWNVPIGRAIDRSRIALEQEAEIQALRNCEAFLTPREREVMTLVVAGMLNKQAAPGLASAKSR